MNRYWVIELPDDIDPRKNDTCDIGHIIDGLSAAKEVVGISFHGTNLTCNLAKDQFELDNKPATVFAALK